MDDLLLTNKADLRAAVLNQYSNYSNLTQSHPTHDDDIFWACWKHFSCESCLAAPEPCAFCSISQVCVPNEDFPFPFGILAPIKRQDICPLSWRERWDMRAKPFSCRCSTMTFMSVAIAVLSTLLGVLLIWLLVVFAKWLRRKWKTRSDGWWRFWQWRPRLPNLLRSNCFGRGKDDDSRHHDNERQPLLEPT